MQHSDIIKKKDTIFSGIVWKLLERVASLLVSLSVAMVLARLLNPKEFGSIEITTILINFAVMIMTSGVGNALIQKKSTDNLDFSTMFWINMLLSSLLYASFFLLSDEIGIFFHDITIGGFIRVQSIVIFIHGLNSIQTAYISNNMWFRYYFFSTLIGKILSGIIGIGMAISGYGAWALVAQEISLVMSETGILWVKGGWRPDFRFSFQSARSTYGFSWRIMLSNLVLQIQEQIRNLTIGRKYSSADIAYFNRGWLLPNTLISNSINATKAVMFPVLSSKQDTISDVRIMVRNWIAIYSFICIPVLVFMALYSKDILILFFSDKWIKADLFVVFAVFFFGARCIEVPICEGIKSIGKADIILKMQVIKTTIALALLLFLVNYGTIAIGLSAAICGVLNIFISTFYGSKELMYSPKMICEDTLPAMLYGVVSIVPVWFMRMEDIELYVKITANFLCYLVTYFLISFSLKDRRLLFCMDVVRNYYKKIYPC